MTSRKLWIGLLLSVAVAGMVTVEASKRKRNRSERKPKAEAEWKRVINYPVLPGNNSAEFFRMFDTRKNGVLSKAELYDVVKRGPNFFLFAEDVRQVKDVIDVQLEFFDRDKNNFLDEEEFTRLCELFVVYLKLREEYIRKINQ